MLATIEEFGGKMNNSKFIICIIFILLLCISLEATYHKIGHCREPFWAKDLELIGSTILVPDDAGIHIIDVSEPNNPIHLGCLEIVDTCREIEVSGDIAYIANTTDGLLILDVNNPQSPQIIGSYDTPDCALSLVVSDSIVYIADRHSGLQIIDVSDPQNPELLGCFDAPNANHVALSGTLIFMSNFMGNIQVIDVSDPSNPSLVYEYYKPQEWVNDIIIIDSIAYIATSNCKFVIYDVSDPTNFNLIATYETTYVTGISILQNMAYLSCGQGGFQVLDISDIFEPELIGALKTPICARKAWISDNIAFIIDLYTGLEIYDISEPDNPDCIGSVDTPNYAMSIAISEDFGYVADYNSYLQIVDFSYPSSPYIINYLGISGTIKDFIVVGNYGYAITSSRLYVLGLFDPTHPVIYSYIESGYSNYALKYKNSHVYVSSSAGVYIVDISNHTLPHIVGECDTPGNAYDLVVSYDMIYVADGNDGLQIIDASDLENPFIVPYFSTPGTPNNVSSLVKTGNILYLACNYDGLKVVDINNPTSPIFLLTIINHPDSKFKTKPIIIGNKLIVEDRAWNEILTFDITDSANPELVNTYIWNLSSTDFAVLDEYLVTTNDYYGVSILDFESITSINENLILQSDIELNNYPNPFNPTTTISFSIPNESKVELTVYNIKGQLVKNLVNDINPAGEHSVAWNGTDENNRPVSSGVYFYKLNVNGKTEAVKKCLMLK
jgi:hypothetical protein